MKKRFLLLVVLMCGVLGAREVTVAEARQVAETWAERNAAFAGDVAQVQTPIAVTDTTGVVLYYKVMLGARGLVIVAGDTNLSPVIAVLPEATSSDLPEGHPLSALLLSDLTERRARLVVPGTQARLRTATVNVSETVGNNNARWDDLLGTNENNGMQTFALDATTGAPARVYSYPKPWSTRQMTHWSQTSTNEYVSFEGNKLYNFFLPYFANGTQVRNAGCVAIAGAAILEFFQVPRGPEGVERTIKVNDSPRPFPTIGGEYKWSCLPTWEKDVELSNDAKNLLGTVPRDLGVLVEMNYKNSGSAAGEHKLADVLTTHYNFVNATSVYTDTSKFASHIYPQVRAGAPVFLSINDGGEGGHAVVAVGYGEDDANNPYTRVFMGWGGAGDAWYALPNIRGGDFLEGAGNYNTISSVITGISLDKNAIALCGRVMNEAGQGVPYETVTVRYQALNESAPEERVITTGLYGEYAVRVPPAMRYTVSAGGETRTVSNNFYPTAINFEIAKEEVLSVHTHAQEALDTAIQEGKLLFILSGPAWSEECTAIKKYLSKQGSAFNENFIFYYSDTDYGPRNMNLGTPGYAIFEPRSFVLANGAIGNTPLARATESADASIQGVLDDSLANWMPPDIPTLTIQGPAITINSGTYTLQVIYSDGTSLILPDVTWHVTSGTATITNVGILTFTEVETATIAAITTLQGEPYTVTLDVRNVALSEIEFIAITGVESPINLEDTPNPVFTCTATLTDGKTLTVSPAWNATEPTGKVIPWITATGLLTYRDCIAQQGKSYIFKVTATYEGHTATTDFTVYGYASIAVTNWDFSPKEVFPGTIVRVKIDGLSYTYEDRLIQTTDLSLAEYRLIESSTGKAIDFPTDDIEIAIPKNTTTFGANNYTLEARKKGSPNTEYGSGISNVVGVMPLSMTTCESEKKGNMPLGWLQQCFALSGTTSTTEPTATDDSDGDGYFNWQEYVLGTDPFKKESTLQLNVVVPPDGGQPEVTWNERPGRTYTLLGAETLDGEWGTVNKASRFFKVQVKAN